jgi:hypothetical protein
MSLAGILRSRKFLDWLRGQRFQQECLVWSCCVLFVQKVKAVVSRLLVVEDQALSYM